ncbi:SMI1/KNR4 family protein [Xanthomonas vesicatoria]|uniref:Glucan biosynthesis protein n=1 Tax=Xanthomonas vesicatoria TaxID=56460 RepID=A0AAJ0IYN7_9XANT|nr:SMI1/KNR4 family protein [Xanthomonas vesicatoria]APO96195.1 SMI1/KNR4 family protein [Xanthomonas vesicatoria]KHM91767.1 glucan biosynthesis protein [Xanthomonas vesicatoria]KHM94219.1 glucan biosynthesis protein [Xanthomonas vesicatoria]MCC8624479.1 SMI1/KNR4 family protein [Xanthomonas vesicatoria]MCC8692874.1 SMI1/KNR4 family protein [Xanthomonas vesicatoria]
MDTSWRPADCPPLAWPTLADDNARLHWYRQVCSAYAALLGEDDAPQPGTGALAVQACEARLGYALPPLLARYHCAIGRLSLAETLCCPGDLAPRIEPLQDAYPSLDEIDASAAEHALATDLLVFGNYLGNGNLWCFHRVTGAVYYFDHDDGAMLTRMFDSVAAYLDALMLLCLGEVYDDDDSAEALLKARFGATAIRKWRY